MTLRLPSAAFEDVRYLIRPIPGRERPDVASRVAMPPPLQSPVPRGWHAGRGYAVPVYKDGWRFDWSRQSPRDGSYH